jgi:hypothetical protein
MPVASMRNGPHVVGPKDFPAPKRASVEAWYKACRKVIPDLPEYAKVTRYSVDRATIIFHGHGWDLFVSRQGRLR